MSYVMYNSQRLIPAPFVSVQKEYQRSQDGTPIGSVFRLNVRGTVIAYMGSPKVDGSFWSQPGYPPDETIPDSSRLKAIIRKQEAIRELFSNDGYLFEIQSADGSQPMKCNPRVISIDFAEGLWYDRIDYTIVLECDILYVNGQPLGEDQFSSFISDFSEGWAFETDETPEGLNLPRTYRVSHTVSAVGKRFIDDSGTLVKPAWQHARDYVLPRLGFNPTMALSSGINNLPSYYGGYNHVRNSTQDELAGTFSVTENWILASGKAIEEFEVSTKVEQGVGLTGVSINGTITGLEERNSDMQLLTTKYTNANSKFTSISSSLLTRAQNYAGITLNPVPLSKTIGRNEINGIISYSYEYNNRPTNLFSGTILENISLAEKFPGDVFAVIPVIGRAEGPVLQSLSTFTERTVSLNIELAVPPVSLGSTVESMRSALYNNPRVMQPNVFNMLFEAARPSQNYTNQKIEFVNPPVENWDATSGRYNYSVEFVFGN